MSSCHDLLEIRPDPRWLAPPVNPGAFARLHHYHLLRELGRGGMGIVWLARDARRTPHPNPETPGSDLVAIKALRPELAPLPRAVRRFRAEADHLRQFRHPHILRALEVSAPQEWPFFVMPYLAGGNLAHALRRHTALTKTVLLRLAQQIAAALAHAHTRGIIHRDLKPANVLLTTSGDACLTDFGLARTVFNDSIGDIEREHREGTAAYMSPAVARGEAEDTRCDIYAFGALLYELLTRQPPYPGPTSAETLRQILNGPPPALETLNPQAPPDLAFIARCAMAREARQRYALMVDVQADLDRAARGLLPLGPHALPCPAPSRPVPRSPLRPTRRLLPAVATLLLLAALLAVQWPGPQAQPADLDLRLTAFTAHSQGQGPDHVISARGNPTARPLYFLQQGSQIQALQTESSIPIGDPLARPSRAPPTAAPRLQLWNTFETAPSAATHSPARLQVESWTDLDLDGHAELLVRADPPADPGPTALYCFDLESGLLRWSAQPGHPITGLLLADLQGRDQRDILVALRSSPPRVDCLSPGGELRWTASFGTTQTTLHLLAEDLRGEGFQEIVAWLQGPQPYGNGQLALLAPNGTLRRHRPLAARPTACLPADLDGDGAAELLVSDVLGQLQVFNRDLLPLQVTHPAGHSELRLHQAADLDDDGEPELVLTAHAPSGRSDPPPHAQLLVLRHNLTVSSRCPLPTADVDPETLRVDLLDRTGDGRLDIVCRGGGEWVFEVRRRAHPVAQVAASDP